jgi:hypothetical protein
MALGSHSFSPGFEGFHTTTAKSLKCHSTSLRGSLTFHVDDGEGGPNLSIDDPAKGPLKYKAAWGISVNGKLEGWLVDEVNKISWFPKKQEPKARAIRKGTTKKRAT